MRLIHDPTTGLLPPGQHGVGWQEAHELLVGSSPGPALDRREATFSAIVGWVGAARPIFGPGVVYLGGDYIRLGALTDVCQLAYLPEDEAMLDSAAASGVAATLTNLMSVIYTWPAPSGYLKERSAVGGCVDAYIADRATIRTFVEGLSSVHDAGGILRSDVRQGVLHLEVNGDD